MELKEFNIEEIEKIYNNNMIIDFPKEELKSLNKIIRLTQEGKYFSYGLYEDGELVGYSLFMTYKNIILLDYFAIIKEKRNSGIGSKAIKTITDYFEDKFDVFILESENPLFAKDEKDKEIRERRVQFYEKNNFNKTDIKSIVYGVNFTIFIINDKINNKSEIVKLLYRLYVAMADEEKCKENVFISE